MVDERIEDGSRIAALLRAEIEGLHEGILGELDVTETAEAADTISETGEKVTETSENRPNADSGTELETETEPESETETEPESETETEPESETETDAASASTPSAGPGAPAFVIEYSGEEVATVCVQPDRCYLVVRHDPAGVAERAREAGLRTRPKAVEPPATLVFVEHGAAVKRVIDVLRASLPPR
ncbi:MAG: hypothetical protein ABEI31_04965 [Halodesulfurarchaeum sp.]